MFKLERTKPFVDFETAKAMVVQKLDFGLLPNWVAKPYLEDGTLQKVKLNSLPLNFGEHFIGLTYKNAKAKDKAVMWVAEQTKIMMGV